MVLRRITFAVLTCVALVAMVSAPAVAVAEGADAGMPQLDPTYYASQIFWLLIAGVMMYTLMSKLVVPCVGRVLDRRDNQVRQDLEMAHRLRDEAEDIKVDYTHVLRDADERAKTMIDRVTREAQQKQDDALAHFAEDLNGRLVQTENVLRQQKQDVLMEVGTLADRFSTLLIQEISKKAAR